MSAYRAQRIRFGILAARHHTEPHRLTPDQGDYLEASAAYQWRVRDSLKAYRRERDAAQRRKAARTSN